jgi:pimaricinolide synthase PimS2
MRRTAALAIAVTLASGPSAAHARAPATEPAAAATPYLLPLSARSAASLLELGREHQKLLAASPETLPQDLAYTASVRRSHHSHRLALVGATPAELQTALATYCAQGSPAPPLAPGQRPKVVFVFSGQGSQWLGMGRQLLREEPQFRAVIAACDRIIQAEAGWSLVAELMAAPTDSRLERIEIVQPALVSLQIALAALWRSWGVTPAAVVGHSMGEVAAAQVCGALSLQDALRIICRRSQLMQRLSGQGAMAMIELGSAEAQPLLRGRQDRLAIAAVNGPRSTVLSGDPRALDEVLVQVEQQKRFFRRVQVEVASHSPQMEPLRADLLAALSAVASQAVTTPMHSTVLGTQVTEGMLDAAYWWRNLREPVLFWPTVERLMQDGHELFVELSPHPIVVPALHEGLAATGRSGTALGSLRREQPERRCLLETLGELYVRGQEVAWAQLYPAGGRCIQLPAYPWQKERYWITEAAGPSAPAAPSLPTPQPAPPPPESPTSREAGSFLTVEWRPLADPAQRQVSRTTGGTWLVFTGDSPVGQAVLAGLRAAGMNCLQVEPGGHFQRLAAGRLQLDPSRPEDYLAVLREAGKDGECAGVLHLWSLGEDPTPTLERLDPEQLRGSRSALLVVQALLQTGWRSLPRLWLVSRGTQGVVRGDAASALAQAPLWGLGQAISTEHPQLVCTAVDLSAAPSPREAAALVSEVLGPGLAEDQLALRGAVAYVPRLVRSGRGALSEAEPAPLAQDGAYLREGGLSEPGLATAQWLVERGARHLVLWADGEPAARERQVLGRLQAAGAQIVTECRELAPCEAVAAILGQLRQRRLPLRGVVLAGESAAPASPRSLHEAPFPQALAAQLQRAFCLHSLTTEEPLDFFICYSALAPPDSGSHRQLRLATSAFFDALAEYRQRRGQPAVSVRWGEVPASARDADRADRADRAAPASPGAAGEKSRQGFFRLLRGAPARLILMNLDVRQLLEAQPSLVGSSLWQELGRERAPSPGSAGGAPLHKELVGARPAERAARVEEHLRRQLSQVLRLEPTRIERQVPFKKLGLDSLMSFELRNRLEASTGVSLSAVLLFTYPNLAALTSYLLTALGLSTPPEPPPPAAAPAPPSPVGADLDELSEDELVSRLSQKLLNAKPRSK